jgi:hypothetical protein
MLKMKLEKEGKKVIDTTMVSTFSTFGNQIYIDVVLTEEDDSYIIRGKEEEYARLNKKAFNQIQAKNMLKNMKCVN